MSNNTQANPSGGNFHGDGNYYNVTTLPFENINEAGAYICNWSGHLLRVPEDGVTSGRSPRLNFVGNDKLWVTKISGNPYIPLTKARLIASNFDINVNF